MVSLAKNRKKPTKKIQIKKFPKKRNKSVHLMQIEPDSTKNNEDNKNYDMNTVDNKQALKLMASTSLINDDDNDDPINLLLPSSKNEEYEIEALCHRNKMECETMIPPKVTDVKNENHSNPSEDILLSLIGGEDQNKLHDSNPEDELLLKKEELSSQIFSEQGTNCKLSDEEENGGDILLSLID